MIERDFSILESVEGWTEQWKCLESKSETEKPWYSYWKANRWAWLSRLCWWENMSRDSLRHFLQRDTQPLLCSMSSLPWCPLMERNEVTSQAKFQKAMKFLLVSAGTFAGSLRPPYRNSVTLTLPYGKTMWRHSQERKKLRNSSSPRSAVGIGV